MTGLEVGTSTSTPFDDSNRDFRYVFYGECERRKEDKTTSWSPHNNCPRNRLARELLTFDLSDILDNNNDGSVSKYRLPK